MFHEEDYDRHLAAIGHLATTRRVHCYTLKHFTAFLAGHGITDA